MSHPSSSRRLVFLGTVFWKVASQVKLIVAKFNHWPNKRICMLVNTRFLTASMRLSFCVFFGFICAQSCTREDDVKFTGFHHFSYPSWSDMALKKLDRTMKKGQTVERYRRWMMASNKDPAVHAGFALDFMTTIMYSCTTFHENNGLWNTN